MTGVFNWYENCHWIKSTTYGKDPGIIQGSWKMLTFVQASDLKKCWLLNNQGTCTSNWSGEIWKKQKCATKVHICKLSYDNSL